MSMFKSIPLMFLIAMLSIENSWAKSVAEMLWPGEQQVTINSKLSQSKVVQHGANSIFLDITFTPPEIKSVQRQRATDMIIVLDRSGSMSEAKKMAFAKAAISDVLGRLQDNDRFALVSFADNAIVQSPLVNVSSGTRHYLNNVVNSIRASGGTNMGDGLNAALSLLESNQSERVRKILLLSDGQANQGITNPEQLAQLATRATHYGAVLSTIGMGLGFNETLMTKLADYGMGHYSYLEDLSGLGAILARDLQDARNIYANSSSLEIVLSDGVKLIDAGGYPISYINSSTVRISTGQMLSSTNKHFVMTFNVPTGSMGTVSLGDMHLNYRVQDQQLQSQVKPEALKLTIVAPEKHQQARESIDKEVYQKSWVDNNLGRMKKKLSVWLREGKKDQAQKAIKEYRQEMDEAAVTSQLPLASPVVEQKLEEMEQQVEDAFAGSQLDQQLKRNRAAKSMQYDSIKTQRK